MVSGAHLSLLADQDGEVLKDLRYLPDLKLDLFDVLLPLLQHGVVQLELALHGDLFLRHSLSLRSLRVLL